MKRENQQKSEGGKEPQSHSDVPDDEDLNQMLANMSLNTSV